LAIDDLSENMEIRAINQQEIAVIETATKRAPVIHIEDAILTTITTLKVVGRCSCGCDSVDFVPSGQAPPYRPIADARAITHAGGNVGITIWGSETAVTGLEVYDAGAGAHDLHLPIPETIQSLGVRLSFTPLQGHPVFVAWLMSPDFDFPTKQHDVVLVDTATLHKAEGLIESCERCNPDSAEIPFDNILDRVTRSDPRMTDYVLEHPAKCPNCCREILGKTFVERAPHFP
jgi:hypothetical protein